MPPLPHWSLLQRIALGNAAIIIVGAVGGTLLTRRLAAATTDASLIVAFATVGIALSIVVNAWIVRTALEPLRRLRREVDGLSEAAGGISAALQAEGDPDLRRLATSINAMYLALQDHNRRLRAVSERLISVQESERLRIARGLHDDTAQALSSLIIGLERLEGRLPAAARADLAAIRTLATDVLRDLRTVIYDLRPSLLDDLGLVAAIRSHARASLEPAGVRVDVHAPANLLAPPATVAINAYRIAQEAISNVVRHAEARSVTITLDEREGFLQLAVEDDGRGFDVARTAREALSSRRLGLLGIQERAELLGGEATIDAAPGRGTRIVVSLPIAVAEPPHAEDPRTPGR
jgi:two-component system, NarL family, sensor histidine kinase UhpB